MASKRGRKNKYETHVVPFFNTISEWLKNGATERQIAEKLGLAYSTFNDYKVKYPELTELLEKGRRNLVAELRGALIKKAMGFSYVETKEVKEHVELPDTMRTFLLDNGFTEEQLNEARLVKTETANKQAMPDVAALNLALKNYDKDDWANDPQMLDIRKQELELKKQRIEDESW